MPFPDVYLVDCTRIRIPKSRSMLFVTSQMHLNFVLYSLIDCQSSETHTCFLCIDFLKILEWRAIFTDWSVMTVMTIGEIKFWSVQLFICLICPFEINWWSFVLTLECRLFGARLHFMMIRSNLFVKFWTQSLTYQNESPMWESQCESVFLWKFKYWEIDCVYVRLLN